jgi:hypothetical protein
VLPPQKKASHTVTTVHKTTLVIVSFERKKKELKHSSLMMEAVRTPETSVDNNFTRQYIPEDSSEHQLKQVELL